MLIEDREFKNINFTEEPFGRNEYEECRFVGCNFSGINLSGISFTDCRFEDCNLSMTKLGGTGFTDATFIDCKILGVHFEHCRQLPFTVTFDMSTLNHSSFFGMKLKKTSFKDCVMQEVDFSNAELQGSVFDKCDLLKTAFENTNLEQVDFRTAFNYAIDPEKNRMKKSRFSGEGLAGLLHKYDLKID